MTVVVTDAIVLHAFDYLESSRIIRLLTRDAGLRSVLARGARTSRKRFGSALDLYAQGTVELHSRPGRELDTLGSIDIARSHTGLGASLERFTGAAVIAELALRFARAEADEALFDVVSQTLDALASAPPARARDLTLAGGWRMLLALGVSPTIDACAECHAPIDASAPATFSHPAGGALCARCAHLARGGRTLPPSARAALRAWLEGGEFAITDAQEVRAHQRLLREFVREHLGDDRPLPAYDAWERDALGTRAARSEQTA